MPFRKISRNGYRSSSTVVMGSRSSSSASRNKFAIHAVLRQPAANLIIFSSIAYDGLQSAGGHHLVSRHTRLVRIVNLLAPPVPHNPFVECMATAEAITKNAMRRCTLPTSSGS